MAVANFEPFLTHRQEWPPENEAEYHKNVDLIYSHMELYSGLRFEKQFNCFPWAVENLETTRSLKKFMLFSRLFPFSIISNYLNMWFRLESDSQVKLMGVH